MDGWIVKPGSGLLTAMKKSDGFHIKGNCKVQKGVLIYIEKTRMGKFNKGGNWKLKFPSVTFWFSFELSPSSYVKEGVQNDNYFKPIF